MLHYQDNAVTTCGPDRNAKIACGPTLRQPEIMSAMETLNNTMRRLIEKTDMLHGRLRPAMRSEPPCPETVAGRQAFADVPIANGVREIDDMACRVEAVIDDAIRRLEI